LPGRKADHEDDDEDEVSDKGKAQGYVRKRSLSRERIFEEPPRAREQRHNGARNGVVSEKSTYYFGSPFRTPFQLHFFVLEEVSVILSTDIPTDSALEASRLSTRSGYSQEDLDKTGNGASVFASWSSANVSLVN